MGSSAYRHWLRLLLTPALATVVAVGCSDSTITAGGADAGQVGADASQTVDSGPVDETPDASTMPLLAMDELVVQSQVEPFRGDQASLPGDDAVERVQQALIDEGFDLVADGWFGNESAGVYADWQASLGYSGLGANGIPGPSSLAALLEGRAEIENEILIGAHTTYSGRTVNQRTRDMLAEAESILGFSIVVTQGSYNAGGVSASAGTHDGGGAVDISVKDLSTTQRWQTVRALRMVGFAAWLRTPDQGPWAAHIHAIAVGDTDLPHSARNQVADYYVGRNGLASHASDNTPADYKVPFTWWESYQSN